MRLIIEQVALNKPSLLLQIQKQNTQRLQLSTEIIKTEKYLQKLLKCQGGRLVHRLVGLIKSGQKHKHFKREYLD
jgi:hypothetical protein